jgi:hypothetical protein
MSGAGAITVMLAVAVLSVGCSNPSPPGGRQFIYEATKITSIKQNECNPTFFDPNCADEPFLEHIGVRITLSQPENVILHAASTYDNGGQFICELTQGNSCPGIPGDGITFGHVYLPDVVELNQGEPFEIMGMIDLMMERDQIIPFGITNVIEGIVGLINDALPTILANNGGLPSDAQGILNFIQTILPPLLGTILSIIGANIASALSGTTDQLIGWMPMLYIAVGGQLASLFEQILPTLVQLIEAFLINEPNSPLPQGLPIQLGVLGQLDSVWYGAVYTDPFTEYRVDYEWIQTG